ncbi:hypothetical protein Tco_1580780, partial [Tanacetum coccineum]
VLGGNYSYTKQVNSIQQLLAYSLITGTKDPSKVTDIELTAHMIVVKNQKDSVSLLPLAAKPKKGKSQTVTPTLPKSQGPKVPGALSKKSKRPKSKKPPTETKDITSTTSDKGTAKTTSRPEGSLGDKDSGGNIPPADMEPIHPLEEDILGAGKEIDEEPQFASIAETHHQFPPPQVDKPRSSHALSTEASDTDSSSDDILRKYDNILP